LLTAAQPALLRRELKKALTLAHPDKWSAGQSAQELAHEVSIVLTRLYEHLEVR
jgi:hypothetical protein